MIFNSIEFAVFLPIVFVLYWFVFPKNLKSQNFLLLATSYVFYGWWDWRFLMLILFSTVVDYLIGIQLEESSNQKQKKLLLYLSLSVNLGLLGFFKYYNFFIESFIEGFSKLGWSVNASSIRIILPVGISFYTFQTLSYTIDIYRKELRPTKDFIVFASFVSFFPQLVAGPIERATNLLPQFKNKRSFDTIKATNGLYLIVWGLFKKMVIADSCAVYANDIFSHYESMNSISLLLGAFYFSFQIYGDFSGYSDIAIGTSKLFGFDLMTNFRYPYFSKNISEFWRRWHISLSTWFRDYLYIPLGGSKISKGKVIRNIFVIFLISGLWHGANWTFVVWGFLHALYFIPSFFLNKKKKKSNKIKEGLSMLLTFFLVLIGWVFFRANTLSSSLNYIRKIFSFNITKGVEYLSIERYSVELIPLIFGFILMEWFSRNKEHPLQGKYKSIKAVFIISCLIILGTYSNISDFIYFQF